ncbi:thermosome subunit alpha [Haloferax denitrificans]|uniref:Thermosome subunit 3 n=1 Tax=Haloferax denitrificans ATCC 35960 TaxID=662478 RepID=M0IUQ6_9EURY|nr:thermosome subunit alpha [Haloferax denitrificans]EMA00552.1 thermosome subunit 3 [Haloferax denitrificans ATCC 35960]
MQQPLYILAEGTNRTHGRSAQDSNIRAGKAVAEAVRTTLGPRGMDKMLVDSSGEVVITNDGATILEKMDIEHPAAQMIVEVSQTQEEEVGDGTTTAAVLTGELLAHAEDLLDADLHPTVIVEGYTEAARIAQDAIDDMVLDAALDDDLLRKVAESSMTGKGTGDVTADVLAKHVVKAVQMVHEDDSGAFNRDDVRVLTRTGASSSATELVEGVVLDKEPVNENMPRSVSDATVAVLDMKLDVRKSEVDTEYNITSVDQLTAAIDAEDSELRGYAKALADAGVDVVFCTKSIDDRVAGFLADAGILAFKSVKKSDARALARATGAKRLGSLADLDESDLGRVDSVSIRTFGDDDLAFVEGGAAAKAVTLFLRGGTEHVVNELERAIEDAVDVVVAAIDKGGVVPGAGATEIAIADRIRSEAAGIEGRKQLAVEAYADAVEALPRTLAENTGMDPIDALVDLRARYENEGIAGIISSGRSGEIGDPVELGVIDPVAVKREAIESATEAATMIVRIDDVIAAK